MNIEKIIQKYESEFNFRKAKGNSLFYSSRKNGRTQSKKNSALWGKVFDLHYKDFSNDKDSIFNTGIWKNSYDNSQIPKQEMDEWIDTTIRKISKFISDDTKILEIGCGNGLLYSRLIDKISAYTGIDPSREAIHSIANSELGKKFSHKTSLFPIETNDLDTEVSEKFDLIIINSVIQYFSSSEYLYEVIAKLENFISSEGVIFIGDVRSFDMRNLYYEDVCRYRKVDKEEFDNHLKKLSITEKELLVTPSFFNYFKEKNTWVQDYVIDLRDGKYVNEMTKFRFDAILFSYNLSRTNIKEICASSHSLQQMKDELHIVTDETSLLLKNIKNSRLNFDISSLDSSDLSISSIFEIERNTDYNVNVYSSNDHIDEVDVLISKNNYVSTDFNSQSLNAKTLTNLECERPNKKEKELKKDAKEVDVTITKVPFYLDI